MTNLWLRISPQGKRSGFVSLPDGFGGVLSITILPKMWALAPRSHRVVEHAAGASTNAICFELDSLEISAGNEVLSALALCLSRSGGGRVGEYELLEAGQPETRRCAGIDVNGTDPLGDLISLLDLAERGGVRRDEQLVQGHLGEAFTRVLTYERFVGMLEPLIFRSRPRYVEKQESLSSPRGRLNDRSLLVARATGMPVVDCTFDELTMDTPLLQIMRAALTVIASDRLPKSLAPLWRPGATRASNLRRHLAHVTVVPRDTARLAAERMWLTPLDRQWQPLLEEAIKVLSKQGYVPEQGAEPSDGLAVHILSEKCWEFAVGEVLTATFSDVRASADRQLAEGVEAPRPRRPAQKSQLLAPDETSFPDYMLRHAMHVIVADAKYKLSSAVRSGDAYQLFTYSHLAKLSGQASDVALLVFPAPVGATSVQSQWQREDSESYSLWAVQLTAPTRRDVASAASWRHYVDRAAMDLELLSATWSN